MPKNPKEFAELFGAKIVGEVPDVGSGPFGMARLAHIMHQRLTPSQGERPGRPTDSTWSGRPKVPMSEATQKRLAEIAKEMSTPKRRVSPMQVAAQLLEAAVANVKVATKVEVQAILCEDDPADSEGVKVHPIKVTTGKVGRSKTKLLDETRTRLPPIKIVGKDKQAKGKQGHGKKKVRGQRG